MAWRGEVWRGEVWRGEVWRGEVWRGEMWRGVAWRGVCGDMIVGVHTQDLCPRKAKLMPVNTAMQIEPFAPDEAGILTRSRWFHLQSFLES
jgi:hypothetical protein